MDQPLNAITSRELDISKLSIDQTTHLIEYVMSEILSQAGEVNGGGEQDDYQTVVVIKKKPVEDSPVRVQPRVRVQDFSLERMRSTQILIDEAKQEKSRLLSQQPQRFYSKKVRESPKKRQFRLGNQSVITKDTNFPYFVQPKVDDGSPAIESRSRKLDMIRIPNNLTTFSQYEYSWPAAEKTDSEVGGAYSTKSEFMGTKKLHSQRKSSRTRIQLEEKGVRRSLHLTENRQEFDSPRVAILKDQNLQTSSELRPSFRLPKNNDMSYSSFEDRDSNYEEKSPQPSFKTSIPLKSSFAKPMQVRLRQKRQSRHNSLPSEQIETPKSSIISGSKDPHEDSITKPIWKDPQKQTLLQNLSNGSISFDEMCVKLKNPSKPENKIRQSKNDSFSSQFRTLQQDGIRRNTSMPVVTFAPTESATESVTAADYSSQTPNLPFIKKSPKFFFPRVSKKSTIINKK